MNNKNIIVKHIKKNIFLKKYSVDAVDLVKLGLFSKTDLEDLEKTQNLLSFPALIKKTFSYMLFSVGHPRFLTEFIIPRVLSLIKFKKKQRIKGLKDIRPISKCNLIASIAASFKPKRILEIGTYIGWGAASFKKACPSSVVCTINPKIDVDSNNPISENQVGSFYRKKKLKVTQIWSDSTKYDYSKLPQVDITYIDGNHSYEYVYKDLESTSKITKKCIILDDYIPEAEANKSNVVYGPWNEGVVKATNDFLSKEQGIKKAYWMEGTKLCVLMK